MSSLKYTTSEAMKVGKAARDGVISRDDAAAYISAYTRDKKGAPKAVKIKDWVTAFFQNWDRFVGRSVPRPAVTLNNNSTGFLKVARTIFTKVIQPAAAVALTTVGVGALAEATNNFAKNTNLPQRPDMDLNAFKQLGVSVQSTPAFTTEMADEPSPIETRTAKASIPSAEDRHGLNSPWVLMLVSVLLTRLFK